MKKLLSVLALGVSVPSVQAADVTVNFGLIWLLDHEGNYLAENSLLQVITRGVDTTGFSAPNPGGFIGENEAILAAFALDTDTVGEPGSMIVALEINYSPEIVAGQELLLRWWPTLTLGDMSPHYGAYYGEYRTDDINSPDSSIAWHIPSLGTGYDLAFIADGTTGLASLQVIPEPSVYVLLGAVGCGILLMRRRR